MKKLYLKLFITTFLGFSGYAAIYAQVTVGSEAPPVSGSLLDLKENSPATDNSTAKKGLLLPRVELTDKTTLLPMFAGDADYQNNTDNKKDIENQKHIGLTVYNMRIDLCEEIYPGVQMWSGTEWVPLTTATFKAETDILTDNRNPSKPEKYKIGKFENAGWWMIENLRADRWPDGTNTGLVFAPPVSDQLPGGYDKRFYYPKMDANDLAKNPQHGYAYNFLAATNLTKEEIANSNLGIRQGICPAGWHIPTLDEWVALINVVRNNPCQYAHSQIGANVGWNMQSMDESKEGRSRSAEQGGFNGSLLGRISIAPEVLEAGERGYFWIVEDPYSTVLSSTTATLDAEISGAAIYPNAFVYLIPVRCKKD